MEKYGKELQPGNVVVVEFALEKYCESNFSGCEKVGFKIIGISYISNGAPLQCHNIKSLSSSSPTKRVICKL